MKNIEDNAFDGCTGLESVSAMGAVAIGISAFANCKKLKSVSFSPSLQQIKKYAFSKCSSLECIELHNNDAYEFFLGEYAFSDCSNLRHIVLPNNVRRICKGAFFSCSSLESISLPPSVQAIHDFAFANYENLTFVAPEGSLAEKYAHEHGFNFKPL